MATALVLPRTVWNARPAKHVYNLDLPVSELWIHHTAGAMPADYHADEHLHSKRPERLAMQQTQKFHMDDRGWSDIAYNCVIFPSGRAYRGRGFNRVGGHTLNHNSHSVAICFYGNFEFMVPTDKALRKCVAIINSLQRRNKLTKNARLGGHTHATFASTACPGDNLISELDWIRRQTGCIRSTDA